MKKKVILKKSGQSEPHGEIVLYKSEDNKIKLEVRLENETVWLTQQMMAELFGTSIPNINIHIKNVIKEAELQADSVIKDFLITAADKKKYKTNFYNLDMIISVGYRIKSLVATRFRIWATQRLREYIVKGFVLDDQRLKNPPVKGSSVPDYFNDLVERIRDIRASEKRVYLRVREIFAMAADYEPSDVETNKFFSVIQNKLHFAATGLTAAEIIKSRALSSEPNMGLTNWKEGAVKRPDISIAKNYLKEEEISELNRIVVMWLDFAEDQTKRRKQVFMKDWEKKLNEFLAFNDRAVLSHAGTVSKEDAEEHANREYDLFSKQRRTLKEAEGEKDSMLQLEQAAKQISLKKKKR